MKNWYTVSLLLLAFPFLKAQVMPQQRVAKAVYVEALGSGIGLSVNYDTRFKPGLTGLGLRAGIGGISGTSTQSQVTLLSLPVLVNYVLGNSRASVEGGLGLMVSYVTAAGKNTLTGDYTTAQETGVSVAGNFGLRLQPKRNGVHFRLYWSPFITDHGLQPQWLGLSLGYGFR